MVSKVVNSAVGYIKYRFEYSRAVSTGKFYKLLNRLTDGRLGALVNDALMAIKSAEQLEKSRGGDPYVISGIVRARMRIEQLTRI